MQRTKRRKGKEIAKKKKKKSKKKHKNVSVENAGAQRLYTKFGFECVKWLVGYYIEEGEDVVEMQLI